MDLLTKAIATIVLIPAFLGNLFFPGLNETAKLKQEIAQVRADLSAAQEKLGSTYQTPDARALFETSISSKIASTDTSFTLTSATDKDGNTLASSTYGFIIDEGSADEELILADCTGTTCTNATRGLSANTGTTTVSSLKKSHRAGANIKITDAPLLLFLKNMLKGKQNIESILSYDSAPSFTTGSNQLASVLYADNLSFAGAPNGSETAKGIYELSTAAETAAGASTGSTGARFAIPASVASSTYTGSSSNRVVVTGSTNTIDRNYIATSTADSYTFGGPITLNATTTMATTSISKLGVGTSTPALSNGISNAGSEYIVGGLGIGAATTSPGNLVVSGLASTTNLIVSGICRNCTGATTTNNSVSVPTTSNTTTSVTASCPANMVVVGGGYSGATVAVSVPTAMNSYPSSPTAWTASATSPNGSIAGFTLVVYAICVN